MKQIFITLLFLLGSTAAMAQNSWEIKEKKNYNVYLNANFASIPLEELKTNPVGASAGIARHFDWGKQGLFLEAGAELGYQQGRSDFRIKDSKDNKPIPMRFSFRYLNGKIPVNVGFKLPIGEDDMALSLYAGANLQYYLATKESWKDFRYDTEKDSDFLDNKLHYGLQAGANFNLNQEWFVGAEFSYNLSKMIKDEDKLYQPNAGAVKQIKNNPQASTISLRIGYRF